MPVNVEASDGVVQVEPPCYTSTLRRAACEGDMGILIDLKAARSHLCSVKVGLLFTSFKQELLYGMQAITH